MLDENFILEMIKPHLNAKRELSEFEFCELFSDLEKREQYEVVNIMIQHDIEYVDEKEEETASLSDVGVLSASGDGDYKQLAHLSNEQLCVLYQKGDKTALAALVDKNKRFIYQLAMKIHGQYHQTTLTVEDLYAEGAIGLMEAAARFDPSLNNKFLTYCWHHIRQKITRSAIDTGFMIRLPVHVFERVMKVNKYRKRYPVANKKELLERINADNAFGFPLAMDDLRKYIAYADAYLNTTSLNVPVGEDGDSELTDFIPDTSESVEDTVFQQELHDMLDNVLSTLTAREEKVIRMRFGLDNGRPMTLEQVGYEYYVTRERIRQIEVKALRKLRHPSRSKRLKDYLD